MSGWAGGFLGFFGHERVRRAIVFLGLAGMLLIFVGNFFGSQPKEATASRLSAAGDPGEYAERVEKRLEQLLAGVQGVGKASVMVTLASAAQYRYAFDEKQSREANTETPTQGTPRVEERWQSEKSYLIVDSVEGRGPLVLTQTPPKIQGVIVVCDGALSPVIVSRVMDIVTTSLGITSLQVSVVPSNKN